MTYLVSRRGLTDPIKYFANGMLLSSWLGTACRVPATRMVGGPRAVRAGGMIIFRHIMGGSRMPNGRGALPCQCNKWEQVDKRGLFWVPAFLLARNPRTSCYLRTIELFRVLRIAAAVHSSKLRLKRRYFSQWLIHMFSSVDYTNRLSSDYSNGTNEHDELYQGCTFHQSADIQPAQEHTNSNTLLDVQVHAFA